MTEDAKIKFGEDFKDFKFIVIDEASTSGLNLFIKVDQRLRKLKPQYSLLPFGGLCVYLVWSQLPPVCDQSFYKIGKDCTAKASLLYRQQGEDQRCFIETHERIVTGMITENDYKQLLTHLYTNNLRDNSFKDAVWIMSKNRHLEKRYVSLNLEFKR